MMIMHPQLGSELVAEIVAPGSPDHAAARALQRVCFARACAMKPDAYLDIVDSCPEQTIPIVVRWRQTTADPGQLVGAIRLELPGATIIESVVRFAPTSSACARLARRTVAELGGFAIADGLTSIRILDIIDIMALAVVQAARRAGITWLWLFPRKTLMPLFHAHIDGVLPPYRFTLCPDVIGWEENERLQLVRQLGVKGLEVAPTRLPVVYEMAVTTLAEDAARRLALVSQRRQQLDLAAFRTALRRAYATICMELDHANTARRRAS
jgi:hypothetical protein